MVGGAIGVRFVERILCGGFEGGVVIQHIGLIGVDVPIRRAGHLSEQACIRECMVEITGLPVEGVRVGEGALEVSDQVGEIVACSSKSSEPALISSMVSSLA